MRFKGIIFDLDGTLLNTIKDINYALNCACKYIGIGTYSIDETKYLVGSGVDNIIKRALNKRNLSIDYFEELKINYQKFYEIHQNDNTIPYVGMVEALNEIKRRGIMIAVLSNKPHNDTVNVIDYYFGNHLFDIVQGQINGIPIKPNPTSVLNIIKKMRINKKEVLYIGDTNVDILTAINAEIECLGVSWGFRKTEELLEAGCKKENIINYPNEILNYLK